MKSVTSCQQEILFRLKYVTNYRKEKNETGMKSHGLRGITPLDSKKADKSNCLE